MRDLNELANSIIDYLESERYDGQRFILTDTERMFVGQAVDITARELVPNEYYRDAP